ncbi:hypothetical protein GCM10009547_01140 [Sporichthya brevicatena]|uniref:Uncharacterized protein n=1 Tax=Sporichthya brevicatena TaxID=171442 RepID=A0ABN1G3I3_9ACTN
MRRALPALTAVVLLGGLAACSDDSDSDDVDARPKPSATATPTGTRTESLGDVELTVPAFWGHQTGDVAGALWCISDAAVSEPVVIRPGTPVESTCAGPENEGDPDPATLVEKAGTFVSLNFASLEPDVEEGTEGDRETIRKGAVLVRVQAPSDIRQQIVATLRQISTDSNGCPITDPISADPTRRPAVASAVGSLSGITSVAACRYAVPGGRFADVPEEEDVEGEEFDDTASESEDLESEEGTDEVLPDEIDPEANLRPTIAPVLPSGTPRTTPTLLSSLRLTGDEARDAVRGIREADVGTGPDAEGGCEGDDARTVRGTEAIVLRITTAAGISQVYLRYGGCSNGFDDGTDERKLSRDVVAPFVSGPNLVPAYGEELLGILDDPDAPATSGHADTDSGGTAPPENVTTETSSPAPS